MCNTCCSGRIGTSQRKMGLFGPKDGPLDWEKVAQIDLKNIEDNDEIDKLEDLYTMIIRADPDEVGFNGAKSSAVSMAWKL